MFRNVLAFLVLYILTLFACTSLAMQTDLYSESNYIPKYGILTSTQLRFNYFQNNYISLYLGGALQRQDKTESSQEVLYDKNLAMALLGFRAPLWKGITLLGELRTEERSHYGIYGGDFWSYSIKDQEVFTEVYGESFVFPYFHSWPITTIWVKEGLRYHLAGSFLLDPYAEAYMMKSPDPNLGRDTEQLRTGLRTIKFIGNLSIALLVYEAFDRDEGNHAEGLLVFAGAF